MFNLFRNVPFKIVLTGAEFKMAIADYLVRRGKLIPDDNARYSGAKLNMRVVYSPDEDAMLVEVT